jgi:phage-related protein
LGQQWGKIFEIAKGIIMPIVSEIVSFVKEKFGMIKQFWDENGAMIIQAIKNVWSIIVGIFQFVAPVILFVLKMLWDTVAGLIDGALKIIMGLIKVFAGLFTGNFGKMWEGIKQLFVGAIEFIWNWLNLLMFGRILGGIKAFITGGITHFTGFWTKAVEIFKNLDTSIWNIVKGMFTKVVGYFKNLYTEGARIFGTLKTFGANTFQALWTAIKTVAAGIYNSVVGNFRSLVTGAKFIIEGLLGSVRSNFNLIKNAIVNPIETAKTLIGKAISGIKSFFSSIATHIKMPHFLITWDTVSAFGKSLKYPTGFNVDWYDKGGVFYGPQVVGVGEKRPEFVGALDDLRKIVREESGGKGNTYNLTVTNNQNMDEATLMRHFRRMEVLHG